MNEVLSCLKERRSCRSFKPEQIKREELEAVLEAGKFSPSGRGAQSAVMVVVQDPETVALLDRLNAQVYGKDIHPFYGAPTVVVVLANTERPTWKEDGSLVMGNLMNAAHSLGLGSCWIHRANEVMKLPEGKALMEKWGLGSEYEGVGNCILGYAAAPLGEAKPRKADYVIFD